MESLPSEILLTLYNLLDWQSAKALSQVGQRLRAVALEYKPVYTWKQQDGELCAKIFGLNPIWIREGVMWQGRLDDCGYQHGTWTSLETGEKKCVLSWKGDSMNPHSPGMLYLSQSSNVCDDSLFHHVFYATLKII